MANPAPNSPSGSNAPSLKALGVVLALLLSLVVAVGWQARVSKGASNGTVSAGDIQAERVMTITGTISGQAQIKDAQGQITHDFADGEAVFISTISRVISRNRVKYGITENAPVHLRLMTSGKVVLFDPETDTTTDLSSFGKDNVQAVRALFETP
ncbi:MAG: photosynthetic complex assembly protein PuhC [Pseudomonadota bacterium]